MEKSVQHIGERVRAVRLRLGLTQSQAAGAADMSSQYLSDLEHGRVSNPTVETLGRLARAYRIGLDELVGHGLERQPKDLPQGLRALLEDDDWPKVLTPSWVDTLVAIKHEGKGLTTKEEFLEAFLALRRILAT